jgi:hypothetical protein
VSLPARLVRDLKANGPKTAVLGVLLLVGLYFWVPPLWRAVAGSASAAVIPEAAATSLEVSPAPAPSPAAPVAPQAVTWHEAERLRTEDELFRSAGPTDIRGNAFVFDAGFLPIDVDFGEEDPETAVANAPGSTGGQTGTRPVSDRAALTLKSTLIGSDRRVAIINGRTYSEGAVVAAAGRTWTLLNIEPRRVLLNGDGGTLELRIDPFAAGRIAP